MGRIFPGSALPRFVHPNSLSISMYINVIGSLRRNDDNDELRSRCRAALAAVVGDNGTETAANDIICHCESNRTQLDRHRRRSSMSFPSSAIAQVKPELAFNYLPLRLAEGEKTMQIVLPTLCVGEENCYPLPIAAGWTKFV